MSVCCTIQLSIIFFTILIVIIKYWSIFIFQLKVHEDLYKEYVPMDYDEYLRKIGRYL